MLVVAMMMNGDDDDEGEDEEWDLQLARDLEDESDEDFDNSELLDAYRVVERSGGVDGDAMYTFHSLLDNGYVYSVGHHLPE